MQQQSSNPLKTAPQPPLDLAAERLATLAALGDQQLHLWRHHPVSQVVLQYLRDFSVAVEVKLLADWRAGSLSLAAEQEMRGRVLAWRDVADLEIGALRAFYSVPAPAVKP